MRPLPSGSLIHASIYNRTTPRANGNSDLLRTGHRLDQSAAMAGFDATLGAIPSNRNARNWLCRIIVKLTHATPPSNLAAISWVLQGLLHRILGSCHSKMDPFVLHCKLTDGIRGPRGARLRASWRVRNLSHARRLACSSRHRASR